MPRHGYVVDYSREPSFFEFLGSLVVESPEALPGWQLVPVVVLTLDQYDRLMTLAERHVEQDLAAREIDDLLGADDFDDLWDEETPMTDNQPYDGGQAFPTPATEQYDGQLGMSLRDWFAGQVLMGMYASLNDASFPSRGKGMPNWAASAYMQADAMLRERNRDEAPND